MLTRETIYNDILAYSRRNLRLERRYQIILIISAIIAAASAWMATSMNTPVMLMLTGISIITAGVSYLYKQTVASDRHSYEEAALHIQHGMHAILEDTVIKKTTLADKLESGKTSYYVVTACRKHMNAIPRAIYERVGESDRIFLIKDSIQHKIVYAYDTKTEFDEEERPYIIPLQKLTEMKGAI